MASVIDQLFQNAGLPYETCQALIKAGCTTLYVLQHLEPQQLESYGVGSLAAIALIRMAIDCALERTPPRVSFKLKLSTPGFKCSECDREFKSLAGRTKHFNASHRKKRPRSEGEEEGHEN